MRTIYEIIGFIKGFMALVLMLIGIILGFALSEWTGDKYEKNTGKRPISYKSYVTHYRPEK